MIGGNQLFKIPRQFPFSTVPEIDLATALKFRAQSPGQRRAIAPEHVPGIEKTVFAVTGQSKQQITHSKNTKWMPRGIAAVPTSVTVPVILIDETVPQGYRLWLEQAAFQLFDTNEADYYWAVYVNGLDILNNGSTTVFPGRPVIDPRPFSLGPDKGSQVMVPSGGHIQVVVLSINAVASSSQCAACLIGTLEGLTQ